MRRKVLTENTQEELSCIMCQLYILRIYNPECNWGVQRSWQTLGVSHAVEIVYVLKDLTLKRYLFIPIYPLRELTQALIQTLIKSSGITDKRIPKSSSPSINMNGSICHQTSVSAGLLCYELKRTKRVQKIHFFKISKRNSRYYYM